MKTILSALFAISIVYSATAQQSEFLEFSLGWRNYQVRDEYQSPLRYRGSGMVRGMGFSVLSQNSLKHFDADYFSANLKNGQENSSPYEMNGFQYQHSKVYHFSEQSGVNYFAGIALKVNFGFRGSDYIGGFDTALSLALVGTATYKESPDNRWTHQAAIRLPFFAWATRPRYTSPSYIKKGNSFNNISHLFLTIPNYFGVDIQIGSTYYLNNGNAFRFDYRGQYYQILPIRPLRVLTNGFKTTALMKVN